MAAGEARIIGPEDLRRAVRSVATLFDAKTVFIIGSQALLVGRDDVERGLRMSDEIDAYPGNLREWQKLHPGQEASEVINGMLGEGSQFHTTHGFFVDGVDDTTATLTSDWQDRAVRRTVDVYGREVEAIAPEPNDVVAAKLVRGYPKDVVFARICMRSGLAKHNEIRKRLEVILPDNLLGIALNRLQLARQAPGIVRSEQGR